MFLTSCLVAYVGLAASNHYEWDDYRWGQHQQDSGNQPVYADDLQHQQNHGVVGNQQNHGVVGNQQYQHGQPNHGQYPQAEGSDQFQGYPPSRTPIPMQPLQPSCTTALPSSATQVTPVPNSVPSEMPKHRILLRQLYQQVIGPNFSVPAVGQLAFLSSPPSLPLASQIRDYPQPLLAKQYDLPQYIEPPPPPHLNDRFNYYS